MAESNVNNTRRLSIRHRGRGEQVWIYLGKLLRMFIYQNDWKVLPMSALIAGLVGMVVRNRLFMNMEGTLMGGFAMVMVCIWNGCFNSIQVICRERDVIKREHRSGMHISSYIFAHMLYQALLCLLQTGVTLYVSMLVGIQYGRGVPVITPFFVVDFGISMFLITYASDMMSLWISCLAHTTTTAMTIMPFVLIFQLVFSGGMLTLPAWSEPLTNFTISNPALKLISAQGGYNDREMVTLWNQVNKMKSKEIEGDITLGQVVDAMSDADNPLIADYRAMKAADLIEESAALLDVGDIADLYLSMSSDRDSTVGQLIDKAAADPEVQARRDESYHYKFTVEQIINLIGEDVVRDYMQNGLRETSYNPAYDNAPGNILDYWFTLLLFVLAFAALSTLTLEFIDKDKR